MSVLFSQNHILVAAEVKLKIIILSCLHAVPGFFIPNLQNQELPLEQWVFEIFPAPIDHFQGTIHLHLPLTPPPPTPTPRGDFDSLILSKSLDDELPYIATTVIT